MKGKRHILSLVILFSIAFLQAQNTAIPDANFENYLETHAQDGSVVAIGDASSMGDGMANNGLVFTSRISNVMLLNVNNLNISDLTGIEDFTALETLICNTNELSMLDVSNNMNLVSLLCGSNNLASLTVSNNTNLETLNCADNQIQTLDLSSNTALKSLTASGNRLTQIDVSNNSGLTFLSISNNRLVGELVVINNPNLENLFCANNQISTLNLSANTVLKNLDAANNALTSLDLSAMNSVVCPDPQTNPATLCQGSAFVNVSKNLLSSLIVANGYNSLFASINSTENPDLFCIQVDSDFAPVGWLKDDWTYYSETTCVDIYTYVPDDNFEQALIDLGYDTVLDNLVLTANIGGVTNLDVSGKVITNLTGIEDFSALQVLDCSTNTIEVLDLSDNTALLQLNVSNNNLSTLDVSANTALTALNCSGNSISNLGLTSNSSLTTLDCSNNSLTSLSVLNNILLSNLNCSFNQIEILNLVTNTALTSVLCNNNNLFALKVKNGANVLLATFNATSNASLFCIEVDNVANANAATGWQKDAQASYNLDCGTYIPDDNFEQALIDLGIDSDNTLNNYVATSDINALTSLNISGQAIADLTGIEDFVALQTLNCSNNALTVLNLDNNLALANLNCSSNHIETLDVAVNTALITLLCNSNALLTLNIENGNNGLLTAFNATNNPSLFCINVDDAIVGNIPGSWQKDAFASYNGDCLNNRFTTIPDALFEQALIDLGYDNTIDGQVLTASIEHLQSLDVSDHSIQDLTGIQDFQSLVELDCSGNYLDALDVSGMQYLERLNCSSNYLLTNDINDTNGLLNTTGTVSLKELYCANNNLNNLDTSANPSLERLDCANNNLSTLSVTGNSLLKSLNCSNNNLTNLDISSNSVLEEVNCNSNQLTNLATTVTSNGTLTVLSCANNNLSTLLVNNYQALTHLNCRSNTMTQLMVTDNTALEFLDFTNNQISDINLANNLSLVEVLASQNALTQLDVTSNTLLENLNCDYNQLNQLEVNVNTLLKYLSCANNLLTTLDLSINANLIVVNFSSNSVSEVMLSSDLGTLKTFNASNNLIEGDMDLSTIAVSACVSQPNQTSYCPDSININLSNNLLSFVNLQNGINGSISGFNATGNPNLTCIQVDDENAVIPNWQKDATTSYSIDCHFGQTYVPDDNFEQALIALGYDAGPLDDYVLTTNIETLLTLDISNNSISDLTGIEDFVALENLNCSGNVLSVLDFSSNVNLVDLDCSNNLLADLNLAGNTALTTLNGSNNSLSNLDLSGNSSLTDLNLANNILTVFDPSILPMLQVFNGDFNQLINLDFRLNPALTSVSCQFNPLEKLNIKNSQNANLAYLNAQNNPNLTCIETDTGTVPAGATWLKDTTAEFAVNCFFGETYVPDDNFEQALIDLGYDSPPLNDYVFTENIQGLTYLNISGKEISDVTGIEDFASLTSLNAEENMIAMANFSNNTLLVNLDVSENGFTALDISSLPNLTALDVSNNALTQIDVTANVNLVDVNVSNNQLSSLNVDSLINLEKLNCASNLLNSLNVTQNPHLELLFCQSNQFISDQLNVQNGNNPNLQLFNATNNPDLLCILVDDPVTVISNIDGTYDSWYKDETANYQSICSDADNDGVPNEDDLCPNTEFGAAVNLFGCAYPNLPNDNFTVQITGETCLNSNNGKITITSQELYYYTVTLIGGNGFNNEYHFTNDIDILNLLAGTYEMCITMEEWPDYISCYTVVITEPNPLEVFSSRLASGKELSVSLSGSSSYIVEFNQNTFITHNSSLVLELQEGLNTLKISTDLACQGVYEERLYRTDNAFVYPNPFSDQITIYNVSEGGIKVAAYNSLGQLVFSKTFVQHEDKLTVDTSRWSVGLYTMVLQTNNSVSTFKIVKK